MSTRSNTSQSVVEPFEQVELSSPRRSRMRDVRFVVEKLGWSRDRLFRLLVGIGAVIQLVDLLQRSRRQWDDYSLTEDFAVFHQAWWLLGHGFLNPFDTIAGRSFWQDEFAVALWPFGLLWPISHSSFTLLVVQDLFIAGGTLVAGLWICDAVRERQLGGIASTALVVGCVAALVVDPFAFETAAFDFHLSAIAAFCLLCCGRALWRGRRRSPFVWALLAMTSGTAAAGLAIGLGAGAFVSSRRLRRRGAVLVLMGVAFVALIVGLHANRGTTLDASYGYLATTHPVTNNASGALHIVLGAAAHPSAPFDLLWSRRSYVGSVVSAGGVLGIFTGWGAGVFLVDILESGLNAFYGFSNLESGGFQNYPAVLFILVGSGLALAWLGAHQWGRWVVRRVVAFLGLAAFVVALTFAYDIDGSIQGNWVLVWQGGVATLQQIQAQVPQSWEVVASQGLIGRFAGRRFVYSYPQARGPFPVRTPHALFLLSPIVGIETAPASATTAAIKLLVTRYHGRVLDTVANNAIVAIEIDRSNVPAGVISLPSS